jgi:hypothetical protein
MAAAHAARTALGKLSANSTALFVCDVQVRPVCWGAGSGAGARSGRAMRVLPQTRPALTPP